MRKIYRKLTKEQRERGVIFASTLSRFTTECGCDTTHEVMADNPDKDRWIRNLKDDSFFDDPLCQYKYNIIRT